MPRIEANGVALHYEWHGPEGGQLVVLVNGLLTDTASWAPHLTRLAERHRCLLYDCRGQGRSGKPEGPYPPRLHADDLAALCAALDLPPASFVGLSNGGNALLHFAADHPERVRRLVLSGVHAHADPLTRAKLASWASAMDAGGAPLRFDVALPWVWGARFLEENLDRLLAFRERAMGIPTRAAIDLVRGAMDHDARADLDRVAAPVLVIVGEEDVLTPRWLADDLVRRLPNARLRVMAGAGHAAALERPEELCALVLDFLAEES